MYMFNMSGLFPCFSFGRVTPVYTRIASRGHALSEEEELREANLYARELSCIYAYAHVTVARARASTTYADSVPCIRIRVTGEWTYTVSYSGYGPYIPLEQV